MIKIVLLIAVIAYPTGDIKAVMGKMASAQECVTDRDVLNVQLSKMKQIGQISDFHLMCEPVELTIKPKV